VPGQPDRNPSLSGDEREQKDSGATLGASPKRNGNDHWANDADRHLIVVVFDWMNRERAISPTDWRGTLSDPTRQLKKINEDI